MYLFRFLSKFFFYVRDYLVRRTTFKMKEGHTHRWSSSQLQCTTGRSPIPGDTPLHREGRREEINKKRIYHLKVLEGYIDSMESENYYQGNIKKN